MADNAASLRQLKIKTGVVRRLVKEKAMYEKEVIDQQARIDKLKANNEDEYVIKKQIEVLQESENIIPDCQKRIKAAIADLQRLLENESNLASCEEYEVAKKLLSEVTAQ
ncbi:Tubulin-specific chaperone A [Trichoplax sp. H2]|uniref:Tubulin-specific chaperone A n=1 Tax=Trichoplax adhaerens TaxID=10228 RepID=B3RS94_TRIAD|nr:hypothetical protein TRIADDRAFT_54517 [Trichoplax adhaerens]EDV27015.1 hypothetical protein TRIADDRAFT_54517 [Trichoplax adhaerens]RDD46323.1 Tubulin-specific chaperone A [Trichoplax sp. H2]|eukprot:XP_002111011.1 hypothetical protein TRIADDRAFT_54517 [Trichoplax adhaerens]